MCGIAGLFSLNRQFGKSEMEKMIGSLAHRGPNGERIWSNEDGTMQFGHRRLSVIDLSQNAAQPMHFKQRFTIVHNGEIYNYIELRDELIKTGYQFKTQSDTEVILAAYDYWGDECLQHFDGMFAFAIWDEQEKTLFAARDRFGQKPFYYFLNDTHKSFGFASELKAFSHLGLLSAINEKQLLLFLSDGFTNDPTELINTFYKSIFQIPPAHYMKIMPHSSNEMMNMKCWWDLNKEYEEQIPDVQAVQRFSELLHQSVRTCLRADIPIGTCLSGGLDSSSIVALASTMHSNNNSYKVFSAVFPGFEKDESRFSEMVAKKFGLQRYTVSVMDLPNEIEKFLYQQDEPVNSSSAYAQYKVFELAASEGIRVLLDGQGADEILAGYSKYVHWFLQEMVFKDRKLYKKEKSALKANGIPFEWGWKNYAAALFPAHAAVSLEKRGVKRIRTTSINREFIRNNEDDQLIFKPFVAKLNDLLYFNACQGGLQELLRYADRNSMAHGCEVRLPYLNHQLVEFIFSLPSTFKIRDGYPKWILRKSVENALPPEITWRKDKVGFEPPQEQWMREPKLQQMIRNAKEELVKRRILEKDVLRKKIQPHGAHAAEAFDWRYLSAAEWLQR